MQIILIRHGKVNVHNKDYYGSRLSEEGKKQIVELVKKGFATPDLIVTSPFQRSVDTAEVFSKIFGVSYMIDYCLEEWHLQKLNLNDEDYAEQERYGWEKERIVTGVKLIILNNPEAKTILLVSHGTVIDMLCSAVSGREARIEDIKKMNPLAYAVVDEHLRLVKDIISDKAG